MPEFYYRGRSANGNEVTGKLVGTTSDVIASRLIGIGITPVEIHGLEVNEHTSVDELWRRMNAKPPTTKDLILFSRQMHTITRTGLPLLRGMTALMETTQNEVLKAALVEVVASLQSGRGLAQSLSRHPKVFSSIFISLVEIGESTGTLDVAFQRLYEYLSLDQDVHDKVKAAVRYPIFVLVAIAIALGIITVFVIPNFAPIFRSLGDAIPLPTKIIIGVSNFAVNSGDVVLGIFAAIGVSVSYWKKTDAGRLVWDEMKIKVPVTGTIIRNAVLSRITRSIAVSLGAGMPINQSLRMIAGSIGNEFLGAKITKLCAGIERGESLSATSLHSGLFTPLILQMVSLGEETGALPELMDEASDYYKREVDYDLDNLSSALEPILIVFVGIVVLVLALGVFLPMWDMVAQAKSG